ncbi:hypothetical protein MJ1_0239 [Nanobdella aerobiophila]|uniref:Uncharacterized protein n=1 Tax=Nanobdella aerobiophila TaxID=2586965 RepID=A0A915SXY9_9ARCH|nr:hypothetical protein [Nanobdella aerobiophila]BBL45410.1 hypothetical protein MJ1_0239 [Nanobdella aerobiophila]
MKKGQSNLVSYLLLGLIIVGLSVGIYEWGIPVIQKSQLKTSISGIQASLTTLASTIQDVAESKGSQVVSISLPSGPLNINYNDIQYSFQSPEIYYNPSVPAIPINYNIFIPCTVNNTLTINGGVVNLCGLPGLEAYANSTNIVLTDINNNTIILPLENINNLITEEYVFNVKVSNNQVDFIPEYNTGVANSQYYPACLLTAVQLGKEIEYQIECRPMYNPQNGQCTWINIVPAGQTGTTASGTVNINLQYNGINVENVNSTICNQLILYNIEASIS